MKDKELQTIWELFEQTGMIGYYNLYKAMEGED